MLVFLPKFDKKSVTEFYSYSNGDFIPLLFVSTCFSPIVICLWLTPFSSYTSKVKPQFFGGAGLGLGLKLIFFFSRNFLFGFLGFGPEQLLLV